MENTFFVSPYGDNYKIEFEYDKAIGMYTFKIVNVTETNIINMDEAS